MNNPKPTPEQFTHNGVLMQPHYDNAVMAWEKMERMYVEKAAEDYVNGCYFGETYYTDCKRRGVETNSMENRIDAFIAGAEWVKKQEGDGWISVKERTPKMIEGKDYSENVLAVIDGRLYVLAYCLLQSDDDGWFCGWANCYGDINGDAEYDDDYNPTHWRPLPSLPTPNTQ